MKREQGWVRRKKREEPLTPLFVIDCNSIL
jgi:hypothetical protein